MLGLIIALHVVTCVFIIFIILIQPGKGYGLSETFGGQTQTIFGTRAATLLTRITAISAGIFLIASLSIAIISSKKSSSVMERLKEESNKQNVNVEKTVSSEENKSEGTVAVEESSPAVEESPPAVE
ncbi:MAG: preprotein translocase subunit SecG [Candidatus Omnitrophota bacterium]